MARPHDNFELVKRDLDHRNKLGKQLYGGKMRVEDKRDWLMEAYEALLDLITYMRAEIQRTRTPNQRKYRRYGQTEKGQQRSKRYGKSPARRKAFTKYNHSPKARATSKRYEHQPAVKEHNKWVQRSRRALQAIQANQF